MTRRTCKEVSLSLLRHNLIQPMGITSKRENTFCQSIFPQAGERLKLCRSASIPYRPKKRKRESCNRMIFPRKLDLQLSSGQKPTFIFHFIYFLYFFFAFKCKEKVGKWAENPQSLVPQRFPAAHFSKINGQKVGKWS